MNINIVENEPDNLSVILLDKYGRPSKPTTTGMKCAYCDKPAKTYVWCREHLISMSRLRFHMARGERRNPQ